MNTLLKLSVVGAFGALVSLTPSGDGALAQALGYGASSVTMPAPGRRVVRHWHPGRWHVHAVATPTAGFAAPTAGLPVPDTRGIGFVLGGLAGPAAFLFAAP